MCNDIDTTLATSRKGPRKLFLMYDFKRLHLRVITSVVWKYLSSWKPCNLITIHREKSTHLIIYSIWLAHGGNVLNIQKSCLYRYFQFTFSTLSGYLLGMIYVAFDFKKQILNSRAFNTAINKSRSRIDVKW